jgi:Zn-dependent peptidase ImmA (M78 family)
MQHRRQLVLDAVNAALKIRRQLKLRLIDSVPIYEMATQLGVDVRLFSASSMEGVYCKSSKPLIIVSSLRPRGRQAFTCAHELGHHVFQHGAKVDEIVAEWPAHEQSNTEEFLADAFAGMLLMPKSAVVHAFNVRHWRPESPTPVQVYSVSSWLGVGYETLIYHMSRTLRLVSPGVAAELLRARPQTIRTQLLGHKCEADLLPVDEHWVARSIDIAVGDYVLLPPGTEFEGRCIERHATVQTGIILCGKTPGVERVGFLNGRWSENVRVSRREYAGLAQYRFMEDPNDEYELDEI